MHKGMELIDLVEQVETYPDATELEVSIISPGGYADIGDSMFEYLVSQKKKGKTVTTIQNGLIGSIATKIFLAGDRRIVDDRYKFWIHNPFMDNVSGDQDQLREMAASLEATEKNLRKFYGEFTSISDEGLDGLMKIETGLTADQCIKFKFATEKKLVPVFNLITMKDEKSFLEHVKSFFTEKPKGVAPTKAAIPGNEAKSMVVTLADGAGSFWVEAEALAEGVPAFMLDADGQPTAEPLADGDYLLEDGSMVSVAGGMVSAVKPAEMEDQVEAPAAEMFTKEQAEAMVKDAVEKALAENSKAVEAQVEAKIMAFKKEVKLGIAPKNAVLTGSNVKVEYKSIHERMEEGREARKKQLNSK